MKAFILKGVNNLCYEEIEKPACPKGWALVKVKASGICSSDISRVFYKGTYHFPTIPGHEFSGIVENVGDDKDKLYIGKKVGVFPLIPCRECEQCKNKHYEMCSNYDYIGSRRDGAFSEYVLAPVWNLVVLDDSISFEAAAMMEPLSVALHAIKLGGMRKGLSVGIIGTGMIGISAAQWAQSMGAVSVIVIGRSESKRNLIENCGAEYKVSSNNETIGVFDFVLEAVGSPSSIDFAINSVKPGGKLVLMGNPSGDINLSQNTYWRILRKQVNLVGTWNSEYDGLNKSDWTASAQALKEKSINVEPLISHRFMQEDLMKGLILMKDHKEPFCKVMTIWNKTD